MIPRKHRDIKELLLGYTDDLNDRTLLGGLKMIMTLNDFDPS
jgi:hypothetical protein